MSYGDLTGRTVVITGASKGIGARASRVLAQAGASVVGLARSVDELTALKYDLENDGLSFDFGVVDLVSPDASEQWLLCHLPPNLDHTFCARVAK